MATAKPKVKRMMFGGAALGAVKKAVTSKAAPMKMQAAAKSAAQQAAPKQFMSNALRSGAMKPPSGMNAAPKQFMSDKLRGSPMPPQVKSAPTPQMAAAANKKMQATAPKQFMSDKLRMGSQSAPNSAAIASIQRMKQKMGDPGLAMAKAYNAQKSGNMGMGSQAASMQKVNTSAPRGAIVPQKMTPQQARGAVEAYQKEQKLQQAANAISKPMQSVKSFGDPNLKLGSTISGAAARALGLGIKKGGVVKKKATKK